MTEHCQACGREYDDVYSVPDEIWERISPKPNGAGLLCPACTLGRVCGLLALAGPVVEAARDAHRGMTEAKWSENLRAYLAARLGSALAALDQKPGGTT